MADGAAYSVTVKTNPSGQACTVSSGSGTVGSANVTNVAVTCSNTASYTVGGTVSGLSGTVVLQDNGGDDLSVTANGSFTFATALRGAAYSVTVKTNPSGQTCTVSSGSGTSGRPTSPMSRSRARLTRLRLLLMISTGRTGGWGRSGRRCLTGGWRSRLRW